MKFNKCLLSVTMAGVLAMAALTGCGSSASSNSSSATSSGDNSGYPKMAITINTSKSGSAVDFGARAFAQMLTDELGGNVIVNSCAGQSEAVREVIGADPDGYSLSFTNNTVVINEVSGAIDFSSTEDVKIAGIIAQGVSSWIGMRADRAKELGISSFEDLVSYTTAHPYELTISTSPNSATDACIRLLDAAGLKAEPVSAGLAEERLTALLTNAVDIYVGTYGFLEQYIQTGELVCLASCSEERSTFSPDVPCTYELGYKVQFPVYYYISAPKDTPDDIIAILNNAMEKIAKDPDYAEQLKGNSNEPLYMNAADAAQYLENQKAELKEIGFGETN